MQTKSLSRISMVAAPMIIACAVLVAGSLARAQSNDIQSSNGRSDDRVCSNRTLQGDYGFTIEGVILGSGIPFRGLALQALRRERSHHAGRPHCLEWHASNRGMDAGHGDIFRQSGLHWQRRHQQSFKSYSRQPSLRGGQTGQGDPSGGRCKCGHRSRYQSRGS
jgi:hypothetical protein